MPDLKPEAIELLLRVKKHIKQKPTRLRMSDWLVKADNENTKKIKGRKYFDYLSGVYCEPRNQVVPDCGTIGCIAGWISVLSTTPTHFYTYHDAVSLLGIDGINAYGLFYPNNWPSEYYEEYRHAKNQRQRASIVGQVIDLFIAGNGSFEPVASRT